MYVGFAVPKGPGNCRVKCYRVPATKGSGGRTEPKLFMATFELLEDQRDVPQGTTEQVAVAVQKKYSEQPVVVRDIQNLGGGLDLDLVIITEGAYNQVHGE